jgi:hypothetical protein
VRALAFTPDGAQLLSGGDEAVLVAWQLATLHKACGVPAHTHTHKR